jgi:hypothetical protein
MAFAISLLIPAGAFAESLLCRDLFQPAISMSASEERIAIQSAFDSGRFELLRPNLTAGAYERHLSDIDEESRGKLFSLEYMPRHLNVRTQRTGSLVGPLAAIYKASPRVAVGTEMNSVLLWPLGLDTLVWRGDGIDPVFPKRILVNSYLPATAQGPTQGKTVLMREMIDRSLRRLYEGFEAQGPERQILAPIVQAQDKTDLNRTIHFEVGIHSSPNFQHDMDEVGHIQVMVSRNPDEKLHIETQWGDLHRRPGEILGEVGRLQFKRGKLIRNDLRASLLKEQDHLIRLTLLQKMLAWANHDVPLDRLIIQVNEMVADILTEYGLPIAEAKATPLVQTIGRETTKEWRFDFDRALMQKAEREITKRILSLHLRKFTEASDRKDRELWLDFSRNEIWALIEIGLIQVTDTSHGTEVIKNLSDHLNPWGHDRVTTDLLSSDFLTVDERTPEWKANQSVNWYTHARVHQPISSLLRNDGFSSKALFVLTKQSLQESDFFKLHFSAEAALRALKSVSP